MRDWDSGGSTTRSGRLQAAVNVMRLWCSVVLALTLLFTAASVHGGSNAAQAMQGATPEAEEEETPEDEAGETPEDEEPDEGSGPSTDMSLTAGQPAVLAQGLTFVTGEELVWSVSYIDAPDLDDAESASGVSALLLQREGATIIRNDVTGKRTKIEAGEGFFRAADDAYTISADGSGSTYWSFELTTEDQVQQSATYEGPLVEGVDEAVYDLELTRFILAPGDTADVPAYNGTALVMGLAGEIEVRNEKLTSLQEGDGKTLTSADGATTVANSGSDVAMYVVASLGDEVSDETAGAGTANQPTPEATAAESQETPDTSVDEAPATQTGDTPVTSINITALAEIYITVTVDGTVAYDGTLASGQSTGPIIGTNFEVYTTSGENTQFSNACGDVFNMGYEAGEVTYYLAATPDSCAP
jgi:hypothetical protein